MKLSDEMVVACRIKDLAFLAPTFASRVKLILQDVPNAMVFETLRLPILQQHYFTVGTSKQSDVLHSAHGFGVAVDFVKRADDGEPGWPADDDPFWRQIAASAARLGLTWGGNWKNFPDRPHVQIGAWTGVVPDQARVLYAAGGLASVWAKYAMA